MNSMIKIYMKVCCMALCLLGLTSQYVQAQVCTSSYSQDWNGSGTTYMSNLGLATVTFESPDMAGSNTTSFSPNGNFFNMDMGWWTPNTLVGAQSLQYTFNWDDTPDGVQDAGVNAVTKTVTITYSQPVMNPIVHIDRLGGNFAADGVNQPYFSNSSMWTLTTAGVGVTKVSGNDQLVVNGNTFYREPDVDLGSANNPIGGEGDGSDGVNGTAAGTLMFTGLVTSLTFDVTGVGPDGLGAIDGIEMIFEANLGSQASFTATPNPNCDGLAVDVENTSVYDVNNDAVTFSWIFDYPGDVDSNEETPQVTYATGGSYMLALILDDGTCQDTTMQTVTVNALGDPTAGYNVDVSECGAPIMVDLTDNSTSDTEITAYEWVITLPDGTSVTVTEPQGSLTLEEEGTVELVYTVTNANGCTSSITESIEVTSEEFVLEIEDTSGCEGTVATVGTLEEGTSITFSPDNVTVDGNSLTVLVGSGMQTYTYTADNGTCTYDGTFTVSDEGVANEIDVVEMLSVCSGGSGTIASDLPEGISVVSDPAGLTTIVDNTLLVVGVDASTLIDLAITYSNGCTSSASVDVAVVEGPEVDLPATVALCEGQNGSTSVDLPTGGSIEWTADGDVTIMSNGSTVTYSTGAMGGNLYATVTNEIGCETMAQIAVTTIMAEMLTLPESISVCEGNSGMLSLSNSAGSGVLWSTMGNVAIEGGDTDNSVAFTVGEGGGDVLVTVTSDSGCVATAQVVVIAGELPEANLPETVYACEGQTIDLPFDPNYTYTLTGSGANDCVMTGSGTIDGNMLSFPFAMTGSGATMPTFCTLEVEITPADCGGLSGAWTSVSDDTYYNGDSGVTFMSGESAGALATSFTPDGAFNTNNNGYWTNPSVAGAQSLEFTLNWDDSADDGEQASDDSSTREFVITFDSPQTNPTIHIDRLGGNYLAQGEAEYVSNSAMWTLTTPGASISRLSGNSQFIVNGNAFYREPNVSLGSVAPGRETDGSNGMNGTAAGSIQISGTHSSLTFEVVGVGVDGGEAIDGMEMIFDAGSGDCCSVTQTVNVQITPDPLNPINSPITQCEGQSVVLNPDALEGYTYSWSSFPFYAFDNAAAGSQEVLVTENTAFFVTATAIDGGCEFSAQIDVMFSDAPEFEANVDEVEVCPGECLDVIYETNASEVWCYWVGTGSGSDCVFTGSGTVEGGTYVWPYCDTGSGSGFIKKRFYNEDGCYSESIIPVNVLDSDVYINADADNPMGVSEITYCPGDEVVLTASSDQGVMSVTWFDASGNEKSMDNPYAFVPTEGGVCTVVATLENGCQAENTITLTPINLMVGIESSTGSVYCEGEEVILTTNTDPDDLVVTWICTDGSTATGSTITLTPVGEVSCTATVMDMGCEDSETFTLTQEIASIAVTPTSATICPGECVDLTALVGDDCETTLWSTGEGTPGITVCPDQTTEYTVTCTTAEGCEATASVIITVSDAPSVDAVASPSVIDEGETSTLSVANPDAACTYVWTDENGNVVGEGADIVVTPDVTTTYTVTCTTEAGCTSTAMVTVTVETVVEDGCSDEDVWIPNTFSPNGDNTNDEYILYSEKDVVEVEFLIYNRWGEQVYKGTNLADAWDGTYEGEQLDPDVYGYCVRWTCPGDGTTEYLKTGNITLIR